MTEVNPYNFVSLSAEKPDRSSGYPGRTRFEEGRYSGRLKCLLEVLSPLISIDQSDRNRPERKYQLQDEKGQPLLKNGRTPCDPIDRYRFLRNSRGQPILQGASLKGMIRAVYEALTDSCLPLAATSYSRSKNPKENYFFQELGEYKNAKCNDVAELCPACRLFGTVTTTSDQKDFNCQGRVSFSDATLIKGALTTKAQSSQSGPPLFFLKVLGSPKPSHHATYGKNGLGGAGIAGRKFYYHHLPKAPYEVLEQEAKRSKALEEFAPVGSELEFDVYIENLSKEELESLVLAIELEDGLAHKIGLGKAIGLGSCAIRIVRERSRVSSARSRYSSWVRTNDTTWFSIKASREKLPNTLVEIMRINKREDDGPIGYPSDFRSYPKEPINARGVFGGPITAKPGRPPWPLALESEPPQDPAPVVRPDQEAAWLREIHENELVFENQKGEERRRPRKAFQGKQALLKTGQWYVLKGSKCVEPVKK